MRVIVCIPYRKDDAHRERAFQYVLKWWRQFDWPVHVASGPADGLMNRSAARNQAARLGGAWDVAVFADADTIGEPRKIRAAVSKAAGRLSYPYDRCRRLSAPGTQALFTGRGRQQIADRYTGSPGGIFAVSRDLYEEVGGFDEGFVGWGPEDVCFRFACQTLGGVHRESGLITHLWHPRPPEEPDAVADKAPGRSRRDRYAEANGDPVRMRALLAELRVRWVQ